MRPTAYTKAPHEQYMQSRGVLAGLLGQLRAVQWFYHTAHWQSEGATGYSHHLLFERLYDGLHEEIDTLAEKMVGMMGTSCVEAQESMETALAWLEEGDLSSPGGLVERALWHERSLQDSIRAAYQTLKDQSTLTLGMDDFLMSLASAHETNLYLLQQVAEPIADVYVPSALTKYARLSGRES